MNKQVHATNVELGFATQFGLSQGFYQLTYWVEELLKVVKQYKP